MATVEGERMKRIFLNTFAECYFNNEPCTWVRYRSGHKADAVEETLEEIETLLSAFGQES